MHCVMSKIRPRFPTHGNAVLVYGAKGALGSALVSHFKKHAYVCY